MIEPNKLHNIPIIYILQLQNEMPQLCSNVLYRTFPQKALYTMPTYLNGPKYTKVVRCGQITLKNKDFMEINHNVGKLQIESSNIITNHDILHAQPVS